MDVFVSDANWNEQFVSPEEWAIENAVKDGDTFTLVRATVHAKTTYRMVNGYAIPERLAFPCPQAPTEQESSTAQAVALERGIGQSNTGETGGNN